MLPSSASDHYDAQERYSDVVVAGVRRAWRRMRGQRWSDAWRRSVGPEVTRVIAEGQQTAAAETAVYATAVLEQLDIPADAPNTLNVDVFAGVTGAGNPIQAETFSAVIQAAKAQYEPRFEGVDLGEIERQVLEEAENLLAEIAATVMADTFRAVEVAEFARRPWVNGYIRMIEPGACSRCAVLAGRFYLFNAGFDRHPQCFPAGVVASGPALEGATRRWYEGELVVLSTASGQELPLTGNHPVLTSRGWVPANLIREGDEVVRSTRPERALPLVVPNHHEVPARVEDVWRSFSVAGLHSVESSPEDFHGDGQQGKVDVVRANRAFNLGDFAADAQHLGQGGFADAAGAPLSLDGEGAAELLDLRHAAHPRGLVGFGNLGSPLVGAHGLVSDLVRFAESAAFNPGVLENAGDGSPAHFVSAGKPVFAGPGQVLANNSGLVQGDPRSRWDAPTLADPVEQSAGYAAVGLDLLQRLAGQVELDRVVLRRSVEFSGHVYSLTSSEGWHVANSLIVSNCRCTHIPYAENLTDDARTNPSLYFDSLSPAQQDKVFTKAGAEAVRLGADISQVVNARRGMNTAQQNPRGWIPKGRMVPVDVFGRPTYITTEGVTRRGVGRRAMGSGRPVRLMPESILALARDRADAIRLLTLYGYIT